MPTHNSVNRIPRWAKVRLASDRSFSKVRNHVASRNLHTVCRSAACPNRAECWSAGRAAFLILGNICTRSCRFCNITTGIPEKVDYDEPRRVAGAVSSLGLTYAVVTSVTRDDLPDGGAGVFAATIRAIEERLSDCSVEVLIPDFQGSKIALRTVLEAGPDILNHNMETVPSRYPEVRPGADYRRSLEILRRAKEWGFVTKTGIMLGLGESSDEVRTVLDDIRAIECSVLTMGQYLQPNKKCLPVSRYYHPEEFERLREEALKLGIREVVAGSLIRSSYRAEEIRNRTVGHGVDEP